MRTPDLLSRLLWICFIAISLQLPLHAANVPDWVRTARIANAEPDVEADEAELNAIIAKRKSENVSVLELDPGFSEYHTDAQYTARVNLIKHFTNKAHANGMKTVTYIPALEVNTVKGEILPNSMYKDHPDWVQKGFSGEPAVFYGSKEDWVEPQMESAWMSPNSGYRAYFIKRIKQMAGSGIDGIWLDVPIYYGITNLSWGGNEAGAITEFKKWASANGFGSVSAPTKIDWANKSFKAWVKWRHVNLAKFIDDVRVAAQSVNPNIVLIDEVFPVDNMDSTSTGLDESYRVSNDNHINVWELDSVSNTKAMKWSNQEDFINKMTMYKWTRGIDRENPSWAFSYGNEVLDASLVMGAAVAAGVSPFESKTPGMTQTVKSSFRKKWFGFIKDNEDALLKQRRVANVGIWYSSATRDFQDYKIGGGYGMFNTYKSPNNDQDWWAQEHGDTPFGKPHLGGYRGAAYALSKLHVPYKIVAAPGKPSQELQGVQFLWLPSVAAISDTDAATIKNFVQNGGVVFATGTEPGVMDENGKLRSQSILKDLFNLTSAALPAPRANKYGQGVAIYRSDILGKEFFASDSGIELANENLSDLEQLVRIHADDLLIVKSQKAGVHVEVSQPSNTKHYIYAVNFSGLKLPLISSPQNVDIQYHAPKGYEVASARVMTPDSSATKGSVTVKQTAKGWSGFTAKVNQFSLIELTLRQASQASLTESPALKWGSAERKEAAESGLNFILNKMRHSSKTAPYKYGVYTNLLNNGGLTDIYAHGHHVSAEHMGLTLRTSACMGNQTAWNQSYEYIRDAMADPMYSVVNWAIDRDRDAPLVSFDDTWLSANAPLDDFRVIRGLLDGVNKFGANNAEDLAQRLLTGMYNTTVTDRGHKPKMDFPNYPNGLVGYAWDWAGTNDATLTPAAVATSIGKFSIDPIPVDYNDLYTMGEAAKRDPRWNATLNSAMDLLLASEVPAVPGLFYNGLQADGKWTGDFENRDINQGKHLKTIQVLWIALHLMNASEFSDDLIPAAKRSKAKKAAQRTLAFFKNYYQTTKRIDEYLTFKGKPVAECVSTNKPAGCLVNKDENLIDGEARIYAQIARLALLLNDKAFAATVISDKILTDRISNKSDPRYGQIGVSTSSLNDAEAWNVLESTLTLCLEAQAGGGTSPTNHAPVAKDIALVTLNDTPKQYNYNASDIDGDSLTYSVVAQPKHGTLKERVEVGAGASGMEAQTILSYQPNAGYTGIDSFTYKANDGTLDSNIATVSIKIDTATLATTVTTIKQTYLIDEIISVNISKAPGNKKNWVGIYKSGATDKNHLSWVYTNSLKSGVLNLTKGVDTAGNYEVRLFKDDSYELLAKSGFAATKKGTNDVLSNPVTSMKIDGNLTDWSSVTAFPIDNHDITAKKARIDWIKAQLAHSNDTLYLAYENYGNIDTAKTWLWETYLDTDSNSETGYQFNNKLGAEYVIQGSALYRYAGKGADWKWTFVKSVSSKVKGKFAELAIPTQIIANPTQINVAFFGNNSSYTGNNESVDFYPEVEQAYFRYQLSNIQTPNHPPVATALSLTTKQDTAVSYEYKATDPDNDKLTFTVVTKPKHGALEASAHASGDAAPTFVYTYRPHKDYVGKDSFSYKANDGKLDSNTARVSITINKKESDGVISNSVTSLKLDGDLTDWSGVTAYPRDTFPAQITPAKHRVDWSMAQLAHSKDTLYIAYKNATNIDTTKWWLWETYLDTDQNAKTGYKFNAKLGAEYVIQGGNLYRYAGTGSNWKWTFVQNLKSGVQGKFTEIAIPTSLIGKPTQINLAFFGNNASYATGGKKFYPEFDFYPNIDTGFFQYKLNDKITVPPKDGIISNPLVSPIKLDKKASDWQSYQSFGKDPKDALAKKRKVSHVDWESATFAHNTTDLYITYKNHERDTLDTVDTWHWEVYLDTDNNPATGYSEMNNMGADYTLQGNELYKFIGGSSSDWDKQWKFIKIVDSAMSHRYSFAEYKLPRHLLGNPTGEIGVQFYGENEALLMKSGKVTEDFYPNEGLKHFKYKM